VTKEDVVPYKQITQLPENVKNNLPKHAQEIYKEAFNSAEDQYGEEDRAHRVAWSAVEQKYEKNDKGNWIKKDSLLTHVPKTGSGRSFFYGGSGSSSCLRPQSVACGFWEG
jgi:cation transport regulator